MVAWCRLATLCGSIAALTFPVNDTITSSQNWSTTQTSLSRANTNVGPIPVVTIYRTISKTLTRYADTCACPSSTPSLGSAGNQSSKQSEALVPSGRSDTNSIDVAQSDKVLVYASAITTLKTFDPVKYTTTMTKDGTVPPETAISTSGVTELATSLVTSVLSATAAAGVGTGGRSFYTNAASTLDDKGSSSVSIMSTHTSTSSLPRSRLPTSNLPTSSLPTSSLLMSNELDSSTSFVLTLSSSASSSVPATANPTEADGADVNAKGRIASTMSDFSDLPSLTMSDHSQTSIVSIVSSMTAPTRSHESQISSYSIPSLSSPTISTKDTTLIIDSTSVLENSRRLTLSSKTTTSSNSLASTTLLWIPSTAAYSSTTSLSFLTISPHATATVSASTTSIAVPTSNAASMTISTEESFPRSASSDIGTFTSIVSVSSSSSTSSSSIPAESEMISSLSTTLDALVTSTLWSGSSFSRVESDTTSTSFSTSPSEMSSPSFSFSSLSATVQAPSTTIATTSTASSATSQMATTTTSSEEPVRTQWVVNPSFDTADANGQYEDPWIFSGGAYSVAGPSLAHTGTHFAGLGVYDEEPFSSVSQVLRGLTVGQTYYLKYWAYNEGIKSNVCHLDAIYADVQQNRVPATTAAAYNLYQAFFTAQATSGTLQFILSCDSTQESVFRLDDVELTVLMGAVLAHLAICRDQLFQLHVQ